VEFQETVVPGSCSTTFKSVNYNWTFWGGFSW